MKQPAKDIKRPWLLLIGRVSMVLVVRASKSLLAIVLVCLMLGSGWPGVPADAQDSPDGGGGSDTDGASEQQGPDSIGRYRNEQKWHSIAEDHVHHGAEILRVRAAGAEEMRIEGRFLDDRFGAWGAKQPFLIDGDEVVLESPTASFAALDPTGGLFTQGTQDWIRFEQRPMWLNVTQSEDGVRLEMEDGDTTGQRVFLSYEFLFQHDIHRPLAMHEDGEQVPVIPTEGGYWLEMPHFSWVLLESDDMSVRGRQAGVLVDHGHQPSWNRELKRVTIAVDQKVLPYEVLVEKAWFDNKLPHLALLEHSWYEDRVDGIDYYVVPLEPSETPTNLVFERYRAPSGLAYTYGNPNVIQAFPDNVSRREAEGPFWFDTSAQPEGLLVQIEAPLGGVVEVHVSRDWLRGHLDEAPIFVENGIPRNVTPVEAGWRFAFNGSITFSIWDAAHGPLMEPSGRPANGTVVYPANECRFRHTTVINGSIVEYDGPTCMTDASILELAAEANETVWLGGIVTYETCGVLYERQSGRARYAPCADTAPVGPLYGLDPFVDGLCDSGSWSNRSFAAFCTSGMTRYEAVGAPVGVSAENASLYRDVLYQADPFVGALEASGRDSGLQERKAWADDLHEFLLDLRAPAPCVAEAPFVPIRAAAPETLCGRAIHEFTWYGNLTEANRTSINATWDALRDADPCLDDTPYALLAENISSFCGGGVPLLHAALNETMTSGAWQDAAVSCPGTRIAGIGHGTDRYVLCGESLGLTIVPDVAAAWDAVRSWGACVNETFLVQAGQGVPSQLCGQDTAPVSADLQDVIGYVESTASCPGQALIVGPGLAADIPLLCKQDVPSAGKPWENEWQDYLGYEPCGGEPVLTRDTNARIGVCETEVPVGGLVKGILDSIDTDNPCPGGQPLVGLGSNEPFQVCGFHVAGDDWFDHSCQSEIITWVPGDGDPVVPGVVCETNGLAEDVEDALRTVGEWIASAPCSDGLPIGTLNADFRVCGDPVDASAVQDELDALEENLPCEDAKTLIFGVSSGVWAVCGRTIADNRVGVDDAMAEWIDKAGCGGEEATSCIEADEVCDGPEAVACVTYKIGSESFTQKQPLGVPGTRANHLASEYAWFVGAPVVIPVKEGQGVKLVLVGVAGSFQAGSTGDWSDGAYYSVTVHGVELSISPDDYEGVEVAGLSGGIAIPKELRHALGAVPTGFQMGDPEAMTIDVALLSGQTGDGNVTLGLRINDLTAHLKCEGADEGLFGAGDVAAAWMIYANVDMEADVDDPRKRFDLTPGARVMLSWLSPAFVPLTFTIDDGAQLNLDFKVAGMPDQVDLVLEVISGPNLYFTSANVTWIGSRMPGVLDVGIEGDRVELESMPEAWHLWVVAGILSDLPVETTRVILQDAEAAAGQIVLRDPAPVGRIDASAQIGDLRVEAGDIARNVIIDIDWQKNLTLGSSGITSMIPLIDLVLQRTYPSGGLVAKELEVDFGSMDVKAYDLARLRFNTWPGSSGFEARFNSEGNVTADFMAEGDLYSLQVRGRCLEATGHLELMREYRSDTDTSDYDRGWMERHYGSGAFAFDHWCTGVPLLANLTKNGKAVVVIDGLEDLTFKFNTTKHDYDRFECENPNSIDCSVSWVDYDGAEFDLVAATKWSEHGGVLVLRVDRLTAEADDPIDLVLKADDLQRLNVTSFKTKGTSWLGGSLGDDDSTWLKWRLVPEGNLDFEYHGEKAGFDYGIDVAVDAGSDHDVVNLDASGPAWWICDNGSFDLARSGSESSRSATRCDERLDFTVLLES